MAAIEGEVDLCEDGAAEADVALEEPQHGTVGLREVADAGDERPRAGERLRVRKRRRT